MSAWITCYSGPAMAHSAMPTRSAPRGRLRAPPRRLCACSGTSVAGLMAATGLSAAYAVWLRNHIVHGSPKPQTHQLQCMVQVRVFDAQSDSCPVLSADLPAAAGDWRRAAAHPVAGGGAGVADRALRGGRRSRGRGAAGARRCRQLHVSWESNLLAEIYSLEWLGKTTNLLNT